MTGGSERRDRADKGNDADEVFAALEKYRKETHQAGLEVVPKLIVLEEKGIGA